MRIVFTYEHRYRVLDVKKIWTSREGNDLITGIDPDKGDYRSFRVDRIPGRRVKVIEPGMPKGWLRIVGNPAAGEDVGVPPGDRTSLPAQARQSRDAVGAP